MNQKMKKVENQSKVKKVENQSQNVFSKSKCQKSFYINYKTVAVENRILINLLLLVDYIFSKIKKLIHMSYQLNKNTLRLKYLASSKWHIHHYYSMSIQQNHRS